MSTGRIVIVGAGIGGLSAAVLLAARGHDVTVLEHAATPGGKLREVTVGPLRVDAGPTVFTMRWVFEELFAAAGADFAERVPLTPLEVLARHAWGPGQHLDLYADIERSADAIGDFAGAADARGYRRFCERSRRIYELLEGPFIRKSEPRLASVMLAVGMRFGGAWDIAPFSTMWGVLGEYFRDPRLRQLFGRYATYCGSSPFLAPATLMLVAHVEQQGVWSIDGGMYRLAEALATLAQQQGARFRYGERVSEIRVNGHRTVGVQLASGEQVDAAAVICNCDVAAIAGGLLGRAAARGVGTAPASRRSLSAITWALQAEAQGFALSRHNVFFSRDYAREFDDIILRAHAPDEPTVYVCAQDNAGTAAGSQGSTERLLCLINAPATADSHPLEPDEVEQCRQKAWLRMEQCGLRLMTAPERTVTTTPPMFERMFPGSGGALYGPASHGWNASFERQGVRTSIPGLYVAGGSAHPGPGVPMAALSGRMAAESLQADIASDRQWIPGGMPGGTSTR